MTFGALKQAYCSKGAVNIPVQTSMKNEYSEARRYPRIISFGSCRVRFRITMFTWLFFRLPLSNGSGSQPLGKITDANGNLANTE